MKLYIFLLVVGVILLLATNSEYCLSNITGWQWLTLPAVN